MPGDATGGPPGRVGRRQFLLGVAGGVGVAATVAATVELPPRTPDRPPTPGPTPDAVATTEWVRSAARDRPVRLVVLTPPGSDHATLPVCLGLHGLGADATWWSDPGTRRLLGAAWAAGTPRYAVVAVDGGDNYWHPYRPADDPMRMLLDEVPAWLTARGVATASAGVASLVAGISMGGAGALLYARERARRGAALGAAAALSPGLFTDWAVASRRPFAGEADWAAHDPLRFVGELADTPLGVWCGDLDPFVTATRRFVDLARPEVGSVTAGHHDGAYYASVMPAVARFLGDHTRTTAATVAGAQG